MRIIGWFFLLILLLVLVAFATLNATTVSLNYYFGEAQLSLPILMALTFALGCFIGLLFAGLVFLKQKKRQFQLKQQIKTLQADAEKLAASALQDH